GTSLTTGGDASLTAGVSTNLTPTNPVSLSWTNVNAGTTFEAQAYGGTIATLGSATSGGTQTIGATGNIGFTTLLANAGDVDVASTAGSIAGTTATAKGSADLAAYGDNTGTTLTTLTGSATLSATMGRIDWANVNAATTFGATAKAGAIELGSATSDGTETIEAYLGLGYTTLKTTGIAGGDVGDIRLTSDTASITGNAPSDTLDANGSFILNAATAIAATALTAETGTGFVKSGGTIGLG
ncbi:hypothetical protein, partial [Methylocapsa sp. S129]|uniref:hypothetical protein n=2 Tax=Methylocapsa sp. S129 TaxID=1641869 RepID=UPI001AEE9F6D